MRKPRHIKKWRDIHLDDPTYPKWADYKKRKQEKGLGLEALYEDYKPLYKSMLKKLPKWADGDEALQIMQIETWNAIKHIEKNHIDVKMRPSFIKKRVKWRLIDYLNKGKRHGLSDFGKEKVEYQKVFSTEDSEPPTDFEEHPKVVNPPPPFTDKVEEKIVGEQRRKVVEKVYSVKLTENEKKVFDLSLEGYSQEEIAIKLNWSKSYVSQLMSEVERHKIKPRERE